MFRFHNIWWISSVAERFSASQLGLCSMDLVLVAYFAHHWLKLTKVHCCELAVLSHFRFWWQCLTSVLTEVIRHVSNTYWLHGNHMWVVVCVTSSYICTISAASVIWNPFHMSRMLRDLGWGAYTLPPACDIFWCRVVSRWSPLDCFIEETCRPIMGRQCDSI